MTALLRPDRLSRPVAYHIMKICAACSRELPKEKFSKKQWQAKQQRRCKDCIADNREVNVEASNDAPLPLPSEGTSDEDLFKQPPPGEECPICLLTMPFIRKMLQYKSCCGKEICIGCVDGAKTGANNHLCPFCRTPKPTSHGEIIERIKKRVDANDAIAMYELGCHYYNGRKGLTQNHNKAMKLYLWAGELGYAAAYNSIGYSYHIGEGVDRDAEKAKYYYELAAIGGNVVARHNLGIIENEAGNMDRAMNWMISAEAGYDKSLDTIRRFFLNGHATKADFEKALRAHKESKDEMTSVQRQAAAAARGLN